MDMSTRPKIAETSIDPSVVLREATIGRCCEVLQRTQIALDLLPFGIPTASLKPALQFLRKRSMNRNFRPGG